MNSLLDFLERVAPSIAEFPRYAKTLFVATLVTVGASVVVYAAEHGSALAAREATAASRDVTVGVTGTGGTDRGLLKRRLASSNSERTVDYWNEQVGATLRISAVSPYLDALTRGGPIESDAFSGIAAEDLPLLDLKVANNGKRVVFLTEAIFDVASSRPDRTAVPVINDVEPSPRAFGISNEGWGPLRDVVVSYRVVPEGTRGAYEQPYPARLSLARIGEYATIKVDDGVRAAGVDLDAVSRAEHESPIPAATPALARALGPFRDQTAVVAGELAYTTQTPSGQARRRVKFEVPIALVQQPPASGGGSVGVDEVYNVALRASGRGYRPVVGIAEALRPGAVKRFAIRVYAPQSSVHRFRVRLRYGDRTLETPPTVLNVFVPRTHEIPQPERDVESTGAS